MNKSPFDWVNSGAADMPPEDVLKANEEALEAAAEAQMEFARLVCDVLHSDPRGADLLQRMRNLTIEMPLMQVSGSLVQGEVALSPADWAYVREGQNSVIRFLEEQIAFALNPPKPSEVTNNE